MFIFTAPLAQAADFKTLSVDTTSWDGQHIEYPKGEEQVTAIKLEIEGGAELPYHCHPFNTVGYVQEGELLVEKMNGESKLFKKGDTIVEVANTWHRGKNLSKGKTELVGFYIGLKDKANTIAYTEENKSLCK